MSDDQTQKPRFEPPPWEQEAFERFRAEQEELRKQAELDAALLAAQARAAEVAAAESAAAEPVGQAESSAVVPAATAGDGAKTAAGETVAEAPPEPAVSPARIDAMLIELRGEEPPPTKTNMAIVNAVIASFVIAGLYIIVQAALLFSKTRAEGASGMLGAVASLIVLMTGIGFLTGGFLLFRKHHL